jgi:putative thioredoxin
MLSDTAHTVTQTNFQEAVLDRSYITPVVVDFWAPWCGPCRQLGPVLERLAAAADGAWELAKVDIDQNPELARRYRVQSIPAVKGFRDGKVAAEFLGAQPETAVRAFLQRLTPSQADRLAAEGAKLLAAGDFSGAEDVYHDALQRQADHAGALLGLGKLLMRRGELVEAERLLPAIPSNTPEGREAAALLGRLRFQQAAKALAATSTTSDDLDALWAEAVTAAAREEYGAALEQFLTITERNRSYREDGGRKAMLSIFEILGSEDPLTREYRPRLSAALY